MIPLWITLYIFCCLTFVTRSSTYLVLALSAAVNIFIDQFTVADSPYLMQVYSSIEFFTCLGVLAFGERHKIYQSVLLMFMSVAHLAMELSLINPNSQFFTPDIYVYTISALIIAQWIGACRGLDIIGNLPWPDLDFTKASYPAIPNHRSSKQIQETEK